MKSLFHFTGRRSVVYVEVPDADQPTYEARQVRLGHKTGEVYPVVAGLREGERVVTNGAFSLDADLQIRGGRSMMAQADLEYVQNSKEQEPAIKPEEVISTSALKRV